MNRAAEKRAEMVNSVRKAPLAWLCAILVPVAYVFFYTPYGMDTTDFGYFYAYGWRILDGQVPYRDFHYIKPALPLYWHAMWMWLTPESVNMLGGKLGFVAELLAASWFAALFCRRFLDLTALGLSLPLLATLGFVFGVHSFPHMPWHTADGILFAGASLWAVASGWTLLSGVLAACAMLCKQSFLFVPLAVALLAIVTGPENRFCMAGMWRSCRVLAGWLAVMFLGWLLLGIAGARADFARLTMGQLAISEALEAGIWIYLRQNWWLPLLAVLPWLAIFLVGRKDGFKCPVWLLPCPLYLVLLTIWYVCEALATRSWIGFGTSWPTLFVVLGGLCVLMPGHLVLPWQVNNSGQAGQGGSSLWLIWRARLCLASLLLVSWSVAISGGYKVPAMFAVPLLLSLVLVHAWFAGSSKAFAIASRSLVPVSGSQIDDSSHTLPSSVPCPRFCNSDLASQKENSSRFQSKACRNLAWLGLVLGLAMFGVGYQYPYVFPARPMPRSALSYDAGQIYPKAAGIMVDGLLYAKLAELKELRAKHGPRYKTLPGFCQAYYLNGDKPLGRSDWLIDWEINAEIEAVYQDLLDNKLYVIMERDQMDSAKADAYERAGYTVPQMVRHSWKIIDETEHLVVFAQPE